VFANSDRASLKAKRADAKPEPFAANPLAEFKTQGVLTERACARGVQVMYEGPGPVPMIGAEDVTS
jgi:thiamine biosynthesis protein ThiC